MAWGSVTTITGVVEGGTTAYQLLVTKEACHVQVTRTDVGSTDLMLVAIYGSVDAGTTTSDMPLESVEVAAADDTVDLIVFGVYSFAIKIDAVGTTDAIVADVKFRFDGGIV